MTLFSDNEQFFPLRQERTFPLHRGLGPGVIFFVFTTVFLVLCDWLAPAQQLIFTLAAIILLGLPHGALDSEIARDRLRPRFGRWWFPVFALPYLALAGCVLWAWHVAPLPSLAAFLALSVWHFGNAKSFGFWQVLARGGAPIALPVLFHPAATGALLAGISQISLPYCPAWLVAASYGWIGLAGATLYGAMRNRGHDLLIAELALLIVLYACLPPLTALAIYFVGLHSPAHMRDIALDPARATRVTSLRTALQRALPVTGLTLLIGLLLWPFYAGDAPHRLLALTIQGLAALTLPHMLLERVCKAQPFRNVSSSERVVGLR